MSIEVLDQNAQATELGFLYEQSPLNIRIPNLMRSAFPMSDPKVSKFFFRIKSFDSEKLDLAIEKFISMLVLTLEEGHELGELARNTRIQVGHVGKNCIIMMPLDSHEVFESLHAEIGRASCRERVLMPV